MAVHEQCVGATDEWYTPPEVFAALGTRFDMDVSHPGLHALNWIPTARVLTTDSLDQEWIGFVWMNPPFGGRNGLTPWLDKFFRHGNGIAFVPDRTSAPWWQAFAAKSDALLFWHKKLRMVRPDGSRGNSPAQGTALMAVGKKGVAALVAARDAGCGLLFQPSK